MKSVRDPIHGYIEFDDNFVNLLDLPEMQRLRNIKQLGFSYLVYPSATHTRFEHSLGAFHLAKRFNDKFQINDDNFLAAALMHDIGHCPFSHSIEWYLRAMTGKSHEEKTIEVLKNLKSEIERFGFDVRKIVNYLKRKKIYSSLISGDIDVDRMDYLMRDSHYTGVAYGVIDSETIIKALGFVKGKFGVNRKYITSIESLLVARYWMTPVVYKHETKEIVQTMFRRAVQEALKSNLSLGDFVRMDDPCAMNCLKNEGGLSEELAEKINQRKIFKDFAKFEDCEFKRGKVGLKKLEEFPEKIIDIEDNLSDVFKIRRGEILISIVMPKHGRESNLYIHDEGKKLEEVSPLVRAILDENKNTYLIVYCSEKAKNKISKNKLFRVLSDSF